MGEPYKRQPVGWNNNNNDSKIHKFRSFAIRSAVFLGVGVNVGVGVPGKWHFQVFA